MFGFGRRGSRGSGYLNLPHTGSRMQGEGLDAAFNTSRVAPTSGNRVMSTLVSPGGPVGGTTSFANYDKVLAARRARGMNLGGPSDPGLSTRGRVGAPGRGGRAVRGGLEGRGVRPAPGSRSVGRPIKTGGPRPAMSRMSASEFGGGMGMGIPANAARGSGNIPMLGRPPVGQFLSGPESMGIPANAARGSGNIPMLDRPDSIGLNVRRNVAKSRSIRAEKQQLAAARAVRDEFGGGMGMGIPANVNRGSGNIPMLARPRNLKPRVPVGGGGAAAGDTGTKIVEKAGDAAKKFDMMKFARNNKKALMIGAGAIGLGALLGNRRKRGTSSGSQSRYGY